MKIYDNNVPIAPMLFTCVKLKNPYNYLGIYTNLVHKKMLARSPKENSFLTTEN